MIICWEQPWEWNGIRSSFTTDKGRFLVIIVEVVDSGVVTPGYNKMCKKYPSESSGVADTAECAYLI